LYEKPFKLEIITPRSIVYQADATSVSAPGVKGGFQVLYNHAPFLSALETGVIKVKDATGNDASYATSGGFVEVKDNKVVVLVESAELPGEIDVERAVAARDRAIQRLKSKSPDVDVERARAALIRALNRLRLAGRV